jgi:hypothetical protein
MDAWSADVDARSSMAYAIAEAEAAGIECREPARRGMPRDDDI